MTNFKGFKGAAKRLDDIDLPRIASQIGVGEDEVHAFIDAETRGSGFDDQGRPKILFERHKFYLFCSKEKLPTAIKAGLANKRAGGYGKESEQYAKLARAMKIDERAALLSCSWGLAQIMGFNHLTAGYATIDAMILAFMADEENHLQAAITFIKNSGLDDELRQHDWKGFAKGYNGTNYAINKYDQKLAAAFAKWSKIKDTPYILDGTRPIPKPKPAQPENKLVENVQKLLREKGYPEVGEPDNRMGNRTRNAILAFEADNGLPLTGKVSDELLAALVKAPVRENSEARKSATADELKDKGIPTVTMADRLKKLGQGILTTMGIGVVGQGTYDFDTIKDKLDSMKGLTDTVLSFSPWIIGAAVAGVAIYFGSKVIEAQVEAYRKGHSV